MLLDSCIYPVLMAILITFLPLLKQMEGNIENKTIYFHLPI